MQGRCLIIGEETYRTSTATDIRGHNAALNALAARIASGNAIRRKPTGCSAGCTQARHGRQSRVFISFFFQTFTESDGALYPRRGERVTELFVAVKYYLCG